MASLCDLFTATFHNGQLAITLTFWRIRLRIEELNPQFGANPMHLFRRILAPVIKIDGFRHAIARNRLAQGMLDDDLIQCGIESGIHHIAG